MTSIWLNSRHMAIRKYGASVSGAKAIVRIEVEVSEPGALGYLLKDIGDAQRDIARERQEAADAARQEKQQQKDQRGLGRQKMLALTYSGGEGK